MILKFYDVNDNVYASDIGSSGLFEEIYESNRNVIYIHNDYRINDASLDCLRTLYTEIKKAELSKLEIVYDEGNLDHKTRSFDISNCKVLYRFSNNEGYSELTHKNIMYDRETIEISYID